MVIEHFKDKFDTFSAINNALISLTAKLRRTNAKRPFTLALSGGETAKALFKLWTLEYSESINWSNIQFFWVDERCVPIGDENSNFLHANELFLEPLKIKSKNIFRIAAEEDPQLQAEAYAKLVYKHVPIQNGLPAFDCIILGVGSDMHTASIFPDNPSLLTSKDIYAVAQKPNSSEKRITMSAPLILNASAIIVPIIGNFKSSVIKTLENLESAQESPAKYILSRASNAVVYTDCDTKK